MKRLTVKAPAKINLVLDVVRKRKDGYHDIKTVMHTLEMADSLTFTPRKEGIYLSCDRPGVPTDERNLVMQAARALCAEFKVDYGVHIHLQKRIPVAAGMGGGSSDAAAALVGLCRFWDIPVDYPRLTTLAARLGSDVPFLLKGGCALCTGRGEKVKEWPSAPGIWLVIVNPGFAVPTPTVYQKLKLPLTREKNYITLLRPAVSNKNPVKIGQYLHNDLETVTLAMHPEIGRIKETLQTCGVTGALMSGSGPTVFGILPSAEVGRAVLKGLGSRYSFVSITRTTGTLER